MGSESKISRRLLNFVVNEIESYAISNNMRPNPSKDKEFCVDFLRYKSVDFLRYNSCSLQ